MANLKNILCGIRSNLFIDFYKKLKINYVVSGEKAHPKIQDYHKMLSEDLVKEEPITCVVKGRQVGVTTIFAAYAYWMASMGKKVVYVSPNIRSSQNFIRKCKEMIDHPSVMLKKESYYKLNFTNGGYVNISSTDAMRGECVDLVIFDEAAWIQGFKKTYMEFLPCASKSGSKIIVSSTPNNNGQHSLFESICKDGDFVYLPCSLNKNNDSKWFLNERCLFSQKEYDQEILALFSKKEEIRYGRL